MVSLEFRVLITELSTKNVKKFTSSKTIISKIKFYNFTFYQNSIKFYFKYCKLCFSTSTRFIENLKERDTRNGYRFTF